MTRDYVLVAIMVGLALAFGVTLGRSSASEKEAALEKRFLDRPTPAITDALAEVRERWERLLGRQRMTQNKAVGDAFRIAEERWESWASAEALMLAYGNGNNTEIELFPSFQFHYLALIQERNDFIRDVIGD